MRLLVYGSLMRGFWNHHYLARAQFVRVARTTPVYTLVSLGAFPGLVAGGTTAVRGELCDVEDSTLAAIDRLEGHPGFYRRVAIALRGGGVAEAYVLPSAAERPVIESGDWRLACASRS